MDKLFERIAARISTALGSVYVFVAIAALLAISGWHAGFSDGWVKWTGFGVTVAAFSMLFFLQKSQNLGDKATHLKLDELIRAIEGARNEVAAAETKSEAEIEELKR